jgi:Spy/CpxP family protein refolding chaperone
MGEFHRFDEAGPGFILDGKLLQELDLSSDQARRVRSLLMEPERRKAFEKIANASRQMIAMYRRYDLDVGAARKLIDNIHNTQQELASLHLRSQQSLRSVLTAGQFERYRTALAEKMRSKMQGKPRPPFKRMR